MMEQGNKITIVCDTREQEHKQDHVLETFKKLGYPVVRTKLFVGDYSLLNNMSVSVDRKNSILELMGNLCNSKDHARIRDEFIRARDNNIKLYVLIEDEYIYNIEGVKYYKVPVYKSNQYKVINGVRILEHRKGEKRSQANLEAMAKAMKTMEEKYGVTFVFAKHEEFGEKILKILGVL